MTGLRSRIACGVALAAGLLVAASQARAKTSWQLVYHEPNQGNSLLGLAAVDATHAWAVGISQQMGSTSPVGIRTIDGVTWSPMSLPTGGGGPLDLTLFTHLAFSDDQRGWMFGMRLVIPSEEAVLWHTDSGGASWTEVTVASEMMEQLQALPTGQLFAAGGATVVRADGGLPPTEVAVAVPGGLSLTGIFMLNADCGYLVATTVEGAGAAQSAVLWSADGGQSWQVRAQDLGYRLRRAWFVSAELGWAAGTDRQGAGLVARTTDGGHSWSTTAMPDHPPAIGADPVPVTDCWDVRFFDDARGLALCLACTGNCQSEEEQPSYLTVFARTSDGGQSWQMDPDYEPQMNAPPFGAMMRFSGMFTMAFAEPNAGYLAGQNNLILRYLADEPEPAGWDTPSCESGSGPDPDGAGGNGSSRAGADGGCGCSLSPPAAVLPDALLLALGLLGLAARRGRRRSRPTDPRPHDLR